MKKMLKKFLVVVAVILVIGIVASHYSLKEIDDANLVAVLEKANDQDYVDIKDNLSKSLKENENMDAEKVVFYIEAPNYAPYYDLEIYYKVDGDWYVTHKKWSSHWIDPETDHEIINMILC